MKININQMMDALMENQEVTVIINGEYYDFEPSNCEHGINLVIMQWAEKDEKLKLSEEQIKEIFTEANEEYRKIQEEKQIDPYKAWDILCGVC